MARPYRSPCCPGMSTSGVSSTSHTSHDAVPVRGITRAQQRRVAAALGAHTRTHAGQWLSSPAMNTSELGRQSRPRSAGGLTTPICMQRRRRGRSS